MSGQRALCPDCGTERWTAVSPHAKVTLTGVKISFPCKCGSMAPLRIVQTLESVDGDTNG